LLNKSEVCTYDEKLVPSETLWTGVESSQKQHCRQ